MSAAQHTSGLFPPPAPATERHGSPAPERIAEILGVVAILATYARHLIATLEQRAVARGFATIARFFGTMAFDTILAHVLRALMRARVLERMLLRRAARGRDLRILPPRAASRRAPAAEDAADSGQTAGSTPPDILTPAPDAAAPAAATDAAARLAATPEAAEQQARRIARDEVLTLDTLPDLAEIEAEVRRSPVGSTIVAICRDLGISPSLCNGAFWNRLFDAIRLYRGSLPNLVLAVKRQERRFEKDEWRHRGLELPEESREGIRRVLGFLIGETPVDPYAVVGVPGAPVEMAAPGAPAGMDAPGVATGPGARGATAATGPP
jgi:hypothetical protein